MHVADGSLGAEHLAAGVHWSVLGDFNAILMIYRDFNAICRVNQKINC